jgi:hypothetical protein
MGRNCRGILILVAKVNATTTTNASWTFPTNTVPGPNAPIGLDFSTYSTDDDLARVAANSQLESISSQIWVKARLWNFPITATMLII